LADIEDREKMAPNVALKATTSVLRQLRPLWFFAAFAAGLLACYIMTPAPEVVLKFPSPYNAGNVVYNDKAHNCFVYNSTEVACPKDGKGVRPQPIVSESFRSGGGNDKDKAARL
jgi:hypothetical protein